MNQHDDLDQAGIKYQDRFEAMINRPYSEYGGTELFPGVIPKACCYYHSIAKTHIFHNGNKRTALASFITFLRLNGKDLDMNNNAAEDFTCYLATDEKFKTNDAVDYLIEEIGPFII
ncbi:type II toxin-antitoxin system death-on-curing family toxin [Cytobacillus oceanisediminis]|nr:type II toxin-antitoxin system death-on-curing family toxin [Cytobacillus oceanisediminis]